MDEGASRTKAAVAGAVAASVSLGLAEVVSGSSRRIPSLVVAVSDVVIDKAPFGIVEGAISVFGTADKKALLTGTVVLALAFGALLGRAAIERGWVPRAGFAGFGLLGLWAASRQPDVSLALSAFATAIAVGAGLATLAVLRWAATEAERPASRSEGPLGPASRSEGPLGPGTGAPVGRRGFLALAGVGVLVAGSTALTGSRLRRRLNVEGARAAVRLPRPTRSDPNIAGAALDGVDGLSPLVTPNDRFYRIDTAILTPQVDPDDWSLRITGRVDEPLELSYADLLDLPMVEDYVTLACVSNEVGDKLVGNAKWLGVPLGDLLDRARPDAGATQIVGRSVDGFTVGFPTEAARDGRTALVAVGMNGVPLPVSHGFPARLVVAGLYGYVSATKWLTEIELTGWDDFDAYWIPRGWAKEAPIKTQSRIDVPRNRSEVRSGAVAIAGVAWAPHRGISRVEVAIDDGDWEPAELSGDTPADTWRQWRYRWTAEPGEHRIRVRATDGTGEVQTAEISPPAPDGATGHHTIRLRAVEA